MRNQAPERVQMNTSGGPAYSFTSGSSPSEPQTFPQASAQVSSARGSAAAAVGGLLRRWLKVPHNVASPDAFIGASNFFELVMAVAIALFGPSSGAALVCVVGVQTSSDLWATRGSTPSWSLLFAIRKHFNRRNASY